MTLTRRTFLQGTGVAMALPLLDAMGASDNAKPKRRMVMICTGLGLHAPFLFPEKVGRAYELTPYLDVIGGFRDDFTIFSGLSHPDVDGGHAAEASYLTAAPHPNSSSFKNTISVDQFAAEQMSAATRYSYLALSTGGGGLSWSRSGVRIPVERQPSAVFAKLFLQGKPSEVKQQIQDLRDGQSILDTVLGQAKRLQSRISRRDNAKLDEYFSSVRDLEQRLVKAEQWEKKPKPRVDAKPPVDINDLADIVGRQRLIYELANLAIQTDSTRIITLFLTATNLVPPIDGVSADWHNLSHHGKDESKIDQLKLIELQELQLFRDFLARLKATKEEGDSLLDRTMVLFGSNLGNASSHDTKNLPMLLAGGGFRHGQHLAFDRKNNKPVSNVFVSMLQQLGLEVDSFASSTGTMTGLEPA